MRLKSFLILTFVVATAVPAGAGDKKKEGERAMLEKMDAVPCGSRQKGVTGVGSIWASVGITHLDANEKLCPRYLLRTDQMEYEIQPVEQKHPVVLPIGTEVLITIKKDHMVLNFPNGERKTRDYEVVAMKQAEPTAPADTTSQSAPAKTEKP